jgi:N-acetylmuramic acid 6-phosphate etherase
MNTKIDLSKISTEGVNSETSKIDLVSTINLARMINKQDQSVALAVKTQLPRIAKAIDAIVTAFNNQGRLIYIGAGTSGRLGILDASEMPPTFGVNSNMVVGMIAGGDAAIRLPIEGAEDDTKQVIRDLKNIHFNKKDVLVGISASGRTPYVVSGIEFANQIGAKTISVATARNSQIGKIALIKIEAVTGAETITGSTRMKSGTAQKMILNMLSTGAMVKIGKTYGNLMVDVQPKNAKLIVRVHNLVKQLTRADEATIDEACALSNNNVKEAVVMILKHTDLKTAKALLKKHNNVLKKVIG